jgi:hypothetical protein
LIRSQVPGPNSAAGALEQETVSLLLTAKASLGFLPVGDVLNRGDEMGWLAIRTGHQRNIHQAPQHLAIGFEVALLDGVGRALACQEEPHRLLLRTHVLRVRADLDRIPDQILSRCLEQVRERAVYPNPSAVQRDQRQPHPGMLEGAVQLFVLASLAQLSLPPQGGFPAKLDLRDHRRRKILQQSNVPLRPQPWHAVDDTQAPQHVSLAVDQGHSGVGHPAQFSEGLTVSQQRMTPRVLYQEGLPGAGHG